MVTCSGCVLAPFGACLVPPSVRLDQLVCSVLFCVGPACSVYSVYFTFSSHLCINVSYYVMLWYRPRPQFVQYLCIEYILWTALFLEWWSTGPPLLALLFLALYMLHTLYMTMIIMYKVCNCVMCGGLGMTVSVVVLCNSGNGVCLLVYSL